MQVKQRQDEEKKQLCALRDQLRPAVNTEQVRLATADGHVTARRLHVCVCACLCVQESLQRQTYSMHQLLGDKQYGTERSGFLYKKSDG